MTLTEARNLVVEYVTIDLGDVSAELGDLSVARALDEATRLAQDECEDGMVGARGDLLKSLPDDASEEFAELISTVKGMIRIARRRGIEGFLISSSRGQTFSEKANRSRMKERHPSKMDDQRDGKGESFYQLKGSVREALAGQAAGAAWAWLFGMKDEQIQNSRQLICGDTLLTEAEFWEFISSPIPATLSAKDYLELGVKPSEVMGHLVDPTSGNQSFAGCLQEYLLPSFFSNPKPEFNVILDLTMPNGETIRRSISKNNGLKTLNTAESTSFYSIINFGESEKWRMREAIVPGIVKSKFGVWDLAYCAGSVLDCLFGHDLDFYHSQMPIDGWDLLRYVLTGIAPQCYSYSVCTTSVQAQRLHKEHGLLPVFTADGGINLFVQPWVQPEALAEIWRKVRPSQAKRTLPSEEDIKIFLFVLENTLPGNSFRWMELSRVWRSQYGHSISHGTLHRVVHRVWDALFPGYDPAG